MKIIHHLVYDRDEVIDEIEEEFDSPREANAVWQEMLEDVDAEEGDDDAEGDEGDDPEL